MLLEEIHRPSPDTSRFAVMICRRELPPLSHIPRCWRNWSEEGERGCMRNCRGRAGCLLGSRAGVGEVRCNPGKVFLDAGVSSWRIFGQGMIALSPPPAPPRLYPNAFGEKRYPCVTISSDNKNNWKISWNF